MYLLVFRLKNSYYAGQRHTMSAEARGPRLGQKEIIREREGFVFGTLQCSGILNL